MQGCLIGEYDDAHTKIMISFGMLACKNATITHIPCYAGQTGSGTLPVVTICSMRSREYHCRRPPVPVKSLPVMQKRFTIFQGEIPSSISHSSEKFRWEPTRGELEGSKSFMAKSVQNQSPTLSDRQQQATPSPRSAQNPCTYARQTYKSFNILEAGHHGAEH